MADTLGTRWAAAGHELMVAGRREAKVQALVSSWARNGSFRDAAEFGDIARFFIRKCRAPWPGSALRGKAIIDCNNPVEVERFTLITQPGQGRWRSTSSR